MTWPEWKKKVTLQKEWTEKKQRKNILLLQINMRFPQRCITCCKVATGIIDIALFFWTLMMIIHCMSSFINNLNVVVLSCCVILVFLNLFLLCFILRHNRYCDDCCISWWWCQLRCYDFELVLRNFDCSLEFSFSLMLLQPFTFHL